MATKIQFNDPVSQAMYEAASRDIAQESLRGYLGMSGIGHPCARKIWYSFRQFTPQARDGRIKMIFSLGNAVEVEVLKWLRLAGYQIDGQQEHFSALNGFFAGHCDGIIHGITQRPHILEIKSASDSRFKAFQAGSIVKVSPVYAAQVQCYMGYSGLERALFVVMNKNTSEIYTERVHFDREAFTQLEAKARWILDANQPPDRAYADEGRECSMCEFAGHCWRSPYIQRHQTCGSCYFVRFKDLQPHCVKYGKDIKHWGRGCPSWHFMDLTDPVPF